MLWHKYPARTQVMHNIQFVPVSAKTGMGIDELLEAILLSAEILELDAPTEGCIDA